MSDIRITKGQYNTVDIDYSRDFLRTLEYHGIKALPSLSISFGGEE